MVATNDKLRMAAVLVARLDRQTADVLLARLSRAEARRLRAAVVELGDVSEEEEETALEELIRQRPPSREADSVPLDAVGLEIDDRLARRLADAVRDEARFAPPLAAFGAASAPPEEEAPFRFLHEARMDELAVRLAREQPQAIAVVLAYLPPARAAEALAALAGPVQVEVVRRLAAMEPADAVVVRELEDALRRWIAPVAAGGKPSVGMTAAQRILSAAGSTTQRHVLDALAEHDEALAERLGRVRKSPPPAVSSTPPSSPPKPVPPRPAEPATPQFSDLALLVDGQLAELWLRLDHDVAVLALAAASDELVGRVLDAIDEPLARRFCRDLDELGPVALADLDAAQAEVAALAAAMFAGAAAVGAHAGVTEPHAIGGAVA